MAYTNEKPHRLSKYFNSNNPNDKHYEYRFRNKSPNVDLKLANIDHAY